MFDLDSLVDILIENIKKLFFPEDWIELDLKFSKSEIFTMLFVEKRKEVTMTELVEYINSPMSTATGIVDRLVRNGYIRRDRSDTDRRIVLIRLTEEGSRLVNSLKGIISKYLNMIMEDLTEEEKRFLAKIALKIMQNLQDRPDVGKTAEQGKADLKKIDIE